jgi:arylsulfatase A-like enzyme
MVWVLFFVAVAVDITLYLWAVVGTQATWLEYAVQILGGAAHTLFILVSASAIGFRLESKLLRVAVASCVVGPAVLLLATKWLYLLVVGEPLAGAVVAFALRQPGQIALHIAQSSPSLIGLSLLLSTASAFLLVELVRDLRGSDSHRQAPTLILIGGLCPLVAGAAMLYAGRLQYQRASGWMTDAGAEAAASRLLGQLGATDISAPPPGSHRPSVVVVLVESLRHDLLETYPEALPNIKRIGDSSITFDRAYATASHSNYSDLAFWYSQYPRRHSSPQGYQASAPFRGRSIFEVFKDAGYHTAYYSSQNEKWGDMINWLKDFGIDHFFHSESFVGETWENPDDVAGLARLIRTGAATAGKVEDSRTLTAAKVFLESLPDSEPFLLGLNLQNTHFSYVQTPEFSNPFGAAEFDFPAVYYRWPESRTSLVRRRYLNSVSNVDSLVGDLARFLKAKSRWDNTIFVVVGDNGEAFYEHGFGNHSGPMYDEVVRTIALVKPHSGLGAPNGPSTGKSYSRPISHIDISASVVHMAGLTAPASFQGRPVFSGECRFRPVFMHSNAIVMQSAVVVWPWKYLRTSWPRPREELYDLSADPLERDDVLQENRTLADSLATELLTWEIAQTRFFDNQLFRTKRWPSYCSGDQRAR